MNKRNAAKSKISIKQKPNSRKSKDDNIVINFDTPSDLINARNKKKCDTSSSKRKWKQTALSFDIIKSINDKKNSDKPLVLPDTLEIVPCKEPSSNSFEPPPIEEVNIKTENFVENSTTLSPVYEQTTSSCNNDYYNSANINLIEEKLMISNTSIEIVPSSTEAPPAVPKPVKKYPKKNPKCKICSREFTSHRKLREHKVEHEGEHPYKCMYCPMYCSTFEEMTAHTRQHRGKLPYQCKKCDLGFQTKDEYNEHQPVHILRKTTVYKKIYQCESCSKEFRKNSDLERHTRVHTGEKPAVCSICNKRFQQIHNLNKHLLIHIQLKAFECEICGKAFGRSDVLNRHVLTHSVDKPHHCPNCSKSFIRMSQLTAHMYKHHQDVLI